MKNILKNKLLIILILIFLCLLFFTNYSKASSLNSFECDIGTVYYTLPLNCKSYVLFKDGSKYVLLYTDVENVHWTCDTDKGYKPIFCYADDSCTTVANFYRTKFSNSEWNYTPEKQEDGSYLLDFANANFMTFSSFSNVTEFITANTDIYIKGSDSLFFQVPPQEVEGLVEIMKALVKQAELEVVPQILIMIAVVIGLVISLIGLRKGFQILVNGLRT